MNTFQFPLIRITLAFILGIVCARFLALTNFQLTACIVLTAAIVCAFYWYSKQYIRAALGFGSFTFLLFLLIGMGVVRIHSTGFQPQHFTHKITKAQSMRVTFSLETPLRSSKKNFRYVGVLKSINNLAVTGRVVVSFPKTQKRLCFKENYAGLVWFIPLQRKPNPGQFDYDSYLKDQSIYGQIFVKKYQNYPKTQTPFLEWVPTFHDKIAYRLSNSLDADTAPIIMALILGQQHDINPTITKDYQLAGAVHILSVSGLHVGFILLLLQLLVKPFPNTKKYRLVKMILIVLGLWGFGILAGLAPSVLRSVTMYSFVTIGLYLKRTVNIYNTLCISAFLILLFDPNTLWNVGFQLSYLALFFIVWLQPKFKKFYVPKTKIGTYFWELTTVSFAAQLGTFPLSLYYFHQFPGLFFVTNWIVLPPLTILMVLGVLAVLLASLNIALGPIAPLLSFSIKQMNACIHWIADQDQFIFQKIPMNLALMLALYLLIFSLVFLFEKRNYIRWMGVGISIITLQLIFIKLKIERHQSEFVVCHTPKKSTIFWKNNNQLYVNLEAKQDQITDDYRIAKFCNQQKIKTLPQKMNCKKQCIAIVDSTGIFPKKKGLLIVLKNSPKCHLERWLENYRPLLVVADGSSTPTIKKLWKMSCKKLKIPFHDTAEKGPFVL